MTSQPNEGLEEKEKEEAIILKQQYEELQSQYKREQENKHDLLKKARDLQAAMKEIRATFNKEKEEKEATQEKLISLKIQIQEIAALGEFSNEKQVLENEIFSLKRENLLLKDQLHQLKDQPHPSQEQEDFKKDNQSNDLKNFQMAEDIPESVKNVLFMISEEDVKKLASKIKKLQIDLWELRLSHQQLQATVADLEAQAKTITPKKSTAKTDLPIEKEEEIKREIEEERKMAEQYENKFNSLVVSLIQIRDQGKVESSLQNPSLSGTVESFYQILQKEPIEEKKFTLTLNIPDDKKKAKKALTSFDEMPLQLSQLSKSMSTKESKDKYRPKTARVPSTKKKKKET